MKHFHRIELVDHPSAELREAAVYLPLGTHKQKASPLPCKAREHHPENDPVPLNLFAYAALGGLIGTTVFS